MRRYGRYERIEYLISQYKVTEDIQFARQAIKLRSMITHPYRLLVKLGEEIQGNLHTTRLFL